MRIVHIIAFISSSIIANQDSLNPIPKCQKTINHVGQIAFGFPCCIGAFEEKKCLSRDLLDDLEHTKLTGAAAQRWIDSTKARIEYFRLKDSLETAKAIMEDSLIKAEAERNLKSAKIKRQKERKKAADLAEAKFNREAQQNVNRIRSKGWPEDIVQAIFVKQVMIGMTSEQAKESWGDPQDINRTINKHGSREQWVYGMHSYLYFEDGVLTTIQN